MNSPMSSDDIAQAAYEAHDRFATSHGEPCKGLSWGDLEPMQRGHWKSTIRFLLGKGIIDKG